MYHFLFIIALSTILSHSKTIKNAKKLLVFGESDSLFTNSYFWKFDHISRTYNQINYRNIWFGKVTAFLIMMAQVFFRHFFQTRTLMLLSSFFKNFLTIVLWKHYKWDIEKHGIAYSRPIVWKQLACEIFVPIRITHKYKF